MTALCNQPEAFDSDLGEDQSRYLQTIASLCRVRFCFFLCFPLFIVSLVVSTRAVDCLERLVLELPDYVSSGMLNCIHLIAVCLWRNPWILSSDLHVCAFVSVDL